MDYPSSHHSPPWAPLPTRTMRRAVDQVKWNGSCAHRTRQESDDSPDSPFGDVVYGLARLGRLSVAKIGPGTNLKRGDPSWYTIASTMNLLAFLARP